MISTGGLVDVVRVLHPDQEGPYTWWSWRGRQFDNDAGWRIDHQLATPALAAAAIAGGVDRESSYAARMSDHSPVWVDYDVALGPGAAPARAAEPSPPARRPVAGRQRLVSALMR